MLFITKIQLATRLFSQWGYLQSAILVGGAGCRTPTGTGSHSQTKYYYIANSKLAKQRVFYNSYLIVLAVSFNLYLIIKE